MIEISVRSNIKELSKKLSALAYKQLPFATSRAINDTVQDCRKSFADTTRKVFNNPVPRTTNALRYKNSTKGNLTARVWINDDPGKGIAPARYLSAEITGGTRHQKRFEKALQMRGLMKSGSFAMPSDSVPRDANGNVPGSFYVRILSYLGAFGEQGYRANMTDKTRRRMARMGRTARGFKTINGAMYFVSNGTGRTKHLAPGVYKKSGIHGSNIEPIFLFVNAASYKARLDFGGVIKKTVADNFDAHLKTRLDQAIATAK